jgi:predicted transcriptional regulator
MTTQRLPAFKLDQRGLARVFGELEAEVMDAVWDLGEPSVAEVVARLDGDVHYKTVMTVMNRLVDKQILTRSRVGRAFAYRPVESRSEFLERVSRCVVEGLVRDFGPAAVAQFVDALDAVDPKLLDRLEDLVRQRCSDTEAGARTIVGDQES